jgi:integrase
MKTVTGFVSYDEKRKRHYGCYTFTDPVSGKRKFKKLYARTATEARERLRKAINHLQDHGPEAAMKKAVTFTALARKFEAARLVPAVYLGEQKIAGRRELSAPTAWLRQLEYFFGQKKLPAITKGEIEKLRIWLVQLPKHSAIGRVDDKLVLTVKENGGQRGIVSINRPLELLRTLFFYAEDEGLIRAEQNPFGGRRGKGLIDRAAEIPRERFPSFGEEMALLERCAGDYAYLRPIIILLADTGLRSKELLSLSWTEGDIDFAQRRIKLRRINAKTNKAREITMTERVHEELQLLYLQTGAGKSGAVFGGIRQYRSAFDKSRKLARVENLTGHAFRHGFVTRSILAGIPPAVVLKASGHSSKEWQRYLNVGPNQLQELWRPLPGQDAELVRVFGMNILRQLTESFGFVWRDGRADVSPAAVSFSSYSGSASNLIN